MRSAAPSFLTNLLTALLLGVVPTSAQESFLHTTFGPAEGITLLGDAIDLAAGGLRLTSSIPSQRGGAWHDGKLHVDNGFVTTFRFRISEPGGHKDYSGFDGGEGFAFVIQNSGPAALGGIGATLGYHGIENSLAVEFDLWDNAAYNGDPNHNHISVHSRGRLPNDFNERYAIATATSLPDMSDAAVHRVVVEYERGMLRIYLDDCALPALTVPIDLDTLLDLDQGRAWLGFTGTTASAWQNHDILDWAFLHRGIVQGDSLMICRGTSATIRVPDGYTVHRWSTGETTQAITVTDSGTYGVTVRSPLGCRMVEERWEIHVTTVDPPSAEIVTDGTTTLCRGDSARLTSSQTGLRYRWSTGDTTESIVAREAGEYELIVVNAAGCSDTSSVTLTIISPPPPPFPSTAIEACDGDSVTLDAGPGYGSYLWSTGETTQSIAVVTQGAYWVRVSNGSPCSPRYDTIIVSFIPLIVPRLNIAGGITLCSGSDITLDAGPNHKAYRWSTGDTTRTITVGEQGTYWVEVVSSGGCRGVSDTAHVTLRPSPTPDIQVSRRMLCRLDSTTLDAGAGHAYRWSTGDTTRTIRVGAPGRYTVEVIDTAGCTGSATVTIEAGDLQTPAITLDGPARICRGGVVTLTAPEGFADYEWSTGENTRSISVRDSGIYRVRIVDANGCDALSEPVAVTIAPTPTVDAGPDRRICAGGSAPLAAVTPTDSGAIGIRWSPAEGLSCTDCRLPVARPTRTTTYTVTVTTPEGCSATDQTTVTVDEGSGQVRLSIPIDLHTFPGSEVTVPIILEDPLDAARVDDLTLNVRFNPGMMRFRAAETGGTLSDGWSITAFPDPNSNRSWYFRLTAPAGGYLRGVGDLLRLRFKTFLGAVSEADLPLTVILKDAPCMIPNESPGHIRLDSLCGLSLRLIETTAAGYALDGNRPNPFNPTTEISFSIGLDGPTRLEILDMTGRSIATLLDRTLQPGRYIVTWDAIAYPSGMYYYRLVSGTWSKTTIMMLTK